MKGLITGQGLDCGGFPEVGEALGRVSYTKCMPGSWIGKLTGTLARLPKSCASMCVGP